MLLLDVFFPLLTCSAAASGDFGDMPLLLQVIKIALAYMSRFILFTLLAADRKLLRLNEDDSLVFTRSVAYPNNGFVGILLCTAVFGTEGTVLAAFRALRHTLHVPFHYAEPPARKRS